MSKYINLDALLKYPIRRNSYDKEHGSEEFINGVESVIEYAKSLHTIESPVDYAYWTPSNYCPSCGAKMDLK